jgi:hypothetical protein
MKPEMFGCNSFASADIHQSRDEKEHFLLAPKAMTA